jgi:quercetin dioxygenase-like cupin family protein
MNIIDLDPGCVGYPEHNHEHDGQEEVYLVLSGHLSLHADGQEHTLRQGDMVRVPPTVTRKLVTGEHSAMVLAIGAAPGQAYSASEGM